MGIGSLAKTFVKKVGALPSVRNAAEDMARWILELRAAGKADEVTEAMDQGNKPQGLLSK